MIINVIHEHRSGLVHAAASDGLTVAGERIRTVSVTRQDDSSLVTCRRCIAALATWLLHPGSWDRFSRPTIQLHAKVPDRAEQP